MRGFSWSCSSAALVAHSGQMELPQGFEFRGGEFEPLLAAAEHRLDFALAVAEGFLDFRRLGVGERQEGLVDFVDELGPAFHFGARGFGFELDASGERLGLQFRAFLFRLRFLDGSLVLVPSGSGILSRTPAMASRSYLSGTSSLRSVPANRPASMSSYLRARSKATPGRQPPPPVSWLESRRVDPDPPSPPAAAPEASCPQRAMACPEACPKAPSGAR